MTAVDKEGLAAADPIGGRWWRPGPLVHRRAMHGGGEQDRGERFHEPTSIVSCGSNAAFSGPYPCGFARIRVVPTT
jgi:hypothetical protein